MGNENLGDEAIIASVLQCVRDRVPNAEIVAFTVRPDDTRQRHGIPAFPLVPGVGASSPPAGAAPSSGTASPSSSVRGVLGRVPGLLPLARAARRSVAAIRAVMSEAAFWPERYRRLRGVDLLIVAGSNQLSDNYGGPWAFPYTLAAWSAAARLAGTRVAFLSLGAGPIRSPLSRQLLREALPLAAYRSYRDVGSRDTIESIGVPGPHRVAPDLAHGLHLEPPPPGRPSGARRTVVVNPFPYKHPRFSVDGDPDAYRRYVEVLAAFSAGLLERGDRVRFVPTQLRQDPPVIADILRALGDRGVPRDAADRLDPRVESFEDLLRVLGEADVVVATRFHGVVLAQMLSKPVIGIAYRRSTTDLLEDMGHGAYAIDVATLTLDGLRERFRALESDPGAAERIARRVREHRDAVGAQFDVVLGVDRSKASGAGSGAAV